MDIRFLGRLAAAVALAGAAAGCISPVRGDADADPVQAALNRRALASAVVAEWHDTSALAARRMMQEYGPPDEVRRGRLVWNGNRPWKRTVVRDVAPLYVEGDELGVVEQTVEFPLTAAQVAEVTAFDGRLSYDERNGELSARSEREELNILRMNLADDVADRRASPAQARDSFASILSLEQSGKSSPYLLGLRFIPGLP